MFWFFIRPPAGREYKYIREKCAIEEASLSQSIRWNALNIIFNKIIIKTKYSIHLKTKIQNIIKMNYRGYCILYVYLWAHEALNWRYGCELKYRCGTVKINQCVNISEPFKVYLYRKISQCIRARLKRDGTCAETRFGLSVKRTSPFKSAWGGGAV
jgi:hypothetical protein